LVREGKIDVNNHRCNAPARARLKNRGPGAIFTWGPLWRNSWRHLLQTYVFGDSQGSCLFYPAVENMLTQIHIQLAARSKY